VFLEVPLAKARRECGKREICMAKMKEMFLKIVVAKTNGNTSRTQTCSE